MPEGPECKKYGEDLAKRVSGKTLVSIDVLSGRFVNKPPSGLSDLMKTLPISVVGAGVHGKFIFWILNDEYSIWSTLGMTGQWSSSETDHSRVRFNLSDGPVYFNDQRNFGTLKFVRGKFQLIEKLKSLGPDMLSSEVDNETFFTRIRKHPDWEITKTLMDQSIVAGVGNYIKADSLWLSRISPKRKVESLSNEELSRLNHAIQQIMRESYQSGGASIKTYRTFDGLEGEYSNRFLVYNQTHDPDGNVVIKETTEDNRTTHWVPDVQK